MGCNITGVPPSSNCTGWTDEERTEIWQTRMREVRPSV